MDPKYMDVYNSLMQDDGRFQLAVDDSGQVNFFGVTDGGEEVKVPVNGMGNFPQVIAKAQPPSAILNKQLLQYEKDTNFWDDKAGGAAAGAALDEFLAEAGDNGLKSLAADYYGYDLEDIAELEQTPAEGFSSALEQEIEGKITETMRGLYNNNQLNAYQQAQVARQQEQDAIQAQQTGTPKSASLLNYEAKVNENNYNFNRIQAYATTPGGFTEFNGTNGMNIEYSKGWFGRPGTYKITDSKGNVQDVPEAQASSFFMNTLGVIPPPTQGQPQGEGQGGSDAASLIAKYGGSPTNRMSPFKDRPPTKEEFNERAKKYGAQQAARYFSFGEDDQQAVDAFNRAQALGAKEGGSDAYNEAVSNFLSYGHVPGTQVTHDNEVRSLQAIKDKYRAQGLEVPNEVIINSALGGIEGAAKYKKDYDEAKAYAEAIKAQQSGGKKKGKFWNKLGQAASNLAAQDSYSSEPQRRVARDAYGNVTEGRPSTRAERIGAEAYGGGMSESQRRDAAQYERDRREGRNVNIVDAYGNVVGTANAKGDYEKLRRRGDTGTLNVSDVKDKYGVKHYKQYGKDYDVNVQRQRKRN